MKKLIFILILLAIGWSIKAQTLGEFKPKDYSFGLNKAKKATRIYIAGFNVTYQIYNEKQSFKQGGSMFGGGYKGDALAEASIGLQGLTNDDVLSITNQLYQDFLNEIKAKGLTIISPDEAAKTSVYSDYEKTEGGKVSLAQFPGMMFTSPTGFEYFIRKVSKSGKEKSGGFLGNMQIQYAKLSHDLDDAIIADVDIFVLFVQDQKAFTGAGANIKIKTNLRLAATEGVTMTDNGKGLKMKGQNTVTSVSSGVNFYHGKMGMGATTIYNGTMAHGIHIDGVIEDTKIQSYASNDADRFGTSTIYGTFFSTKDTKSSTSKIIDVDRDKYKKGVYMAAKEFMDYHVDAFFSKLE